MAMNDQAPPKHTEYQSRSSLRFLPDPLADAKAPPARTKTIVISENNPVLADGIGALLGNDAVLSNFAVTSIQGMMFSEVLKLSPEILIIDPWQSPAAREIIPEQFKEICTTSSVLGYCSAMSLIEAAALRAAGFRGLIPKTVQKQELVRIVCAVAFGGAYFHETYAGAATDPGVNKDPNATSSVLTERELETLRQIALGNSMKEIAGALNISTKTVDTYKSRAIQKLNLRTRSDIVKYAIRAGWME